MTTTTPALITMPSIKTLQNRGIPIKVHQVQMVTADDGRVRWDRAYDANDNPILDDVFVRLTAASLADIEEKWGSIDGWQVALEAQPFLSLVETLALIWDCGRVQAGAMMVDSGIDDYATATGAAFAQANGGSPDAVVRVLEAGVKTTRTKGDLVSLALDTTTDQSERDRAEVQAAVAASRETRSHPDGPSGDPQDQSPGTNQETFDLGLAPSPSVTPGLNGSPLGYEPAEASPSSGL